MDQEIFRKVHPSEYLKRFLVNDVRPDGRSPSSARKVSLTTGSIGTAVGSAMLKLGRTTVMAGVHATLVAPPAASSEQGILDINVELLSLASSSYIGNRSSDEAACLSEYVRGLLMSHVDLTELCVEAGVLVWKLLLTIYCLDNDGNLEDSVLLAAVAAIRDVKLPTIAMVDEEAEANGDDAANMNIDKSLGESSSVIAMATAERKNSLEVLSLPLSVSFVLFDGNALIDPSAEEEAVCDSRLTFLFRPSGELRGILKPGGKNLPENLYRSCLAQARERVPVLFAKLNET